MIRRIILGVLRRAPRPIIDALLKVRGVLWRRQLRAFLQSRATAPARTRPVSIVIPSYNDLPLLTKCLESLERTLLPDDEIIVVDDYCQAENSAALLRLANRRTQVVLKDARAGFAVTVNVGMARAQHDIVLLNSDIVALEHWLEHLQAAAYSSHASGLVSAKLLYPDGRIQYGGTFWPRWFAPQWFAHRFAGAKFDFPPSNVRRLHWGAGGACLYVRRDVYSQIGGLDETYWLGFEDVDYAMAARTAGFDSVFEPNAVLVHHESASRGFHQGNRELRSMRTFWNKWAHLHTDRNISASKIRIIVDSTEPSEWLEFAHALAEGLGDVPITDPSDVGASFTGVSVVMTESALNAAWSAHTMEGLAIAMLPSVPRGNDPRAAALQPEFDYLAVSNEDRALIEGELGYPVLDVVTPFCDDRVRTSGPAERPDLVVYYPPEQAGLAEQLRQRVSGTIHLVSAGETGLTRLLRDTHPRILVNLAGWESQLQVMIALSSNVALLSGIDPRYASLLRDGVNSLCVPFEAEPLIERISGLLDEPTDGAALAANALAFAQKQRAMTLVTLRTAIARAATTRSAALLQ